MPAPMMDLLHLVAAWRPPHSLEAVLLGVGVAVVVMLVELVMELAA